jgi:hypothetical protein
MSDKTIFAMRRRCMMRNHLLLVFLVFLLLSLGLACNPFAGTKVDIGATATAIAASIFATQTAAAPTQTPIIIVVTATPGPPTSPPPTEPPPPPTTASLGSGAETPIPQLTPALPTFSPLGGDTETPPAQKTLSLATLPPPPQKTPALSTPSLPKPSGKGKLAFTKSPDGNFHSLWIANLDGSGQQFVLDHAAGPSWAPDGKRLAFYGEEGVDRQKDANGTPWVIEGGSNGIWSMLAGVSWQNADFHQYAQEGSARWAAWAPSGDMLAYDATPGNVNRRVYFLGTTDNRQFDIQIPGEQADWSPDSQKVVYRSCRENKCGLWVSNRDDSGAHQITQVGDDAFPRWSPKGDKIVFSRKETGNHDVYLVNVDGSNAKRLTTDPAHDTLPCWTHDGSQIVFKSARSGSWAIYIMNADGSGQKEIIKDVGMGNDWSFDHMDVSSR